MHLAALSSNNLLCDQRNCHKIHQNNAFAGYNLTKTKLKLVSYDSCDDISVQIFWMTHKDWKK